MAWISFYDILPLSVVFSFKTFNIDKVHVMVKAKKRSKIEVGMDEHAFTTDSSHILQTYGVTTCIAMAIRGEFYDNYDDLIQFCGIWHWSGFANPNNPRSGEDIVNTFLGFAQDRLEFSDDTALTIHELSFIGGEKEQRDDHGELLLSGTEKEVRALREALGAIEEFDFPIVIEESDIHWHNFITHDDMSLTVQVQLNSVDYQVLGVEHTQPIEVDENSQSSSLSQTF